MTSDHPLERIPSLGSLADCVRVLIDLIMSDYKPLFRVDLDGGTVSAEAPGHGQSFFAHPAEPLPDRDRSRRAVHQDEPRVQSEQRRRS